MVAMEKKATAALSSPIISRQKALKPRFYFLVGEGGGLGVVRSFVGLSMVGCVECSVVP